MDPQWYPVVLDLLPDFVKLMLTRKLGRDFRSLQKFETYGYVIGKRQDRYDDDDDDDDDDIDYGGDKFTMYSLASTQSKRSKNMYFGSKKYYGKKYQNVTDIATRRKIFTWWEKMF